MRSATWLAAGTGHLVQGLRLSHHLMTNYGMKKPEELREQRWSAARKMPHPHHAAMEQLGVQNRPIAGKPCIAILNPWSEIQSCHTILARRREISAGLEGRLRWRGRRLSLCEIFHEAQPAHDRKLLARESRGAAALLSVDGAV